MQEEPELLSPEDLADWLWNILRNVKNKTQIVGAMEEMRRVIERHSEATVARAFDRLTIAVKKTHMDPILSDASDDDKEVWASVYQYTKDVHGLLWDLYRRVLNNVNLTRVDYDTTEPSHYTRLLMEHFQRLHNISTYARLKNLTLGDAADEYDAVVAANLERDKNALKLSVALKKPSAKEVSTLHYDLYGSNEDVFFFMPTPYLRHKWVKVRINGTEKEKKKEKKKKKKKGIDGPEKKKVVVFFEFPSVLSHFGMHSRETLQTLELSNLDRVQFICDGNVLTSFVRGNGFQELIVVKYSTGMASVFDKLSNFRLINLYSLRSVTLDDFSPTKLLTLYFQGLTAYSGTWNPQEEEWEDLVFSAGYKKLHTLVVSGGHVSISRIDCTSIKHLEIGFTKSSKGPRDYMGYQGSAPFPRLNPNMKLQKLILRDGIFESIPSFHKKKKKKNKEMSWTPVYLTLVELQLVNVTVVGGESLREFSRLNSSTSGPKVVVWDNVRVRTDEQGGAGFQDGDRDPNIYGPADPTFVSTILRRMVHCTNLTIANERGALDLEELLRYNKSLRELKLINVPNMRLVLPGHVANQLVSITRPSIVFDSFSEVILGRRGLWKDAGIFKVNQEPTASPDKMQAVIIDAESPSGEGTDPGVLKTTVLDEIDRISTWLGEVPVNGEGDFVPEWIIGNVADDPLVRNRFLSWEETVLRWFTRSMDSEDLLLPFYEGVSMDFVFDTPREYSRVASRHAGVNMYQTVMEYDDDTQSLYHQILFLPDEEVIQGYAEDYKAQVADEEEDVYVDQGQGSFKTPDPTGNPSDLAENALTVNRPALINSLVDDTVSFQFRIRAGPRHEGWAFVNPDPAQDTEQIGIGSSTLSFDHTFTFAPYNPRIGRGYVTRLLPGDNDQNAKEIVYIDRHLRATGKIFEFQMGTLTRDEDGTFKFTIGCQTLMTLIGVRFLESMAFVGKDVILQEQDIRSNMEREGLYLGEELETQVRKMMTLVSSPAELGRPLWMNSDGRPFRVVPEDVESTVLYQEIVDNLRMLLIGIDEDEDDQPFSKFRAHLSNFLLLGYFAGRCMGNVLRTIRNVDDIVLERFETIYRDVWVPMVQWATRQYPVVLNFDLTRAADLFQNLEEIFALAKAKRKYVIPRPEGQSKEERNEVLENKRVEVATLFGKVVAGIQVLFDPHLYELMYDAHQEIYNAMDAELSNVLQAYMELEEGGRVDPKTAILKAAKSGPLIEALEERITVLFAMLEEFFFRAFQEEGQAALNMSLQDEDEDEDEDEDYDDKGKGEEVVFEESSESPKTPIVSPGVLYSRRTRTQNPQESIRDAYISQIDRLSAAKSKDDEEILEHILIAGINVHTLVANAEIASARQAKLLTPVKSPTPNIPFTAPIAEIATSKRRASISPESLRAIKRSPPTELIERRSMASGGVHQSMKSVTDVDRFTLLRRGVGAVETASIQLGSSDETLRTKKGLLKSNIGVQNPPIVVIDLTTPSPPKEKKKKAKVVTPTLSTSERDRLGRIRKPGTGEIVPHRLDFGDDDLYGDDDDDYGKKPSDVSARITKIETKAKAKAKICANCPSKAMQRCARCKSTYYCRRACQLKHFEQHRHECKQKQ